MQMDKMTNFVFDLTRGQVSSCAFAFRVQRQPNAPHIQAFISPPCRNYLTENYIVQKFLKK